MLYVVEALHDGSGHGQVSAVLLLTHDFKKALDLARDVSRRTGFSFGRDTYVAIHNPEMNQVYKKGNIAAYAYIRRKYVTWEEEWFDADLKDQFCAPFKKGKS